MKNWGFRIILPKILAIRQWSWNLYRGTDPKACPLTSMHSASQCRMILAKGLIAVHWEMAFADCQAQCCGYDCSPLGSEQGQKWTLYTHSSLVSRPEHLPYNMPRPKVYWPGYIEPCPSSTLYQNWAACRAGQNCITPVLLGVHLCAWLSKSPFCALHLAHHCNVSFLFLHW